MKCVLFGKECLKSGTAPNRSKLPYFIINLLEPEGKGGGRQYVIVYFTGDSLSKMSWEFQKNLVRILHSYLSNDLVGNSQLSSNHSSISTDDCKTPFNVKKPSTIVDVNHYYCVMIYANTVHGIFHFKLSPVLAHQYIESNHRTINSRIMIF